MYKPKLVRIVTLRTYSKRSEERKKDNRYHHYCILRTLISSKHTKYVDNKCGDKFLLMFGTSDIKIEQ